MRADVSIYFISKWHLPTHCKGGVHTAALASSLPNEDSRLNGNVIPVLCNVGCHAWPPSNSTDSLEVGCFCRNRPQSKERSELIEANHPTTQVKRSLLPWQQMGSDNKMNSHFWSSKNSFCFALSPVIWTTPSNTSQITQLKNPIDLQENPDRVESVWEGYCPRESAADGICLCTQNHTCFHFPRQQRAGFKGIYQSA